MEIIGHDQGGYYTDSGYVTDKEAQEMGFTPYTDTNEPEETL